MKRFDCPACGGALRLRLLPHVPRSDGKFAFSCIYCSATLTYSDDVIPLGRLLWGTKLRSVATFLGGMILFSAVTATAGAAWSYSIIGLFALGLAAGYLFSPKPAYVILSAPGSRVGS